MFRQYFVGLLRLLDQTNVSSLPAALKEGGHGFVSCFCRRKACVCLRQKSASAFKDIPRVTRCTLTAPLRFISTQSNIFVFIGDDLARGIYPKFGVSVYSIHGVVQRDFLVVDDMMKISTHNQRASVNAGKRDVQSVDGPVWRQDSRSEVRALEPQRFFGDFGDFSRRQHLIEKLTHMDRRSFDLRFHHRRSHQTETTAFDFVEKFFRRYFKFVVEHSAEHRCIGVDADGFRFLCSFHTSACRLPALASSSSISTISLICWRNHGSIFDSRWISSGVNPARNAWRM